VYRQCSLLAIFFVSCWAVPEASAQAVKHKVPGDAPPPKLMYHGLVPGRDTMPAVREALGEPEKQSRFYNYKMYYPAEGRPGKWDVVHMHGNTPDAGLANIDAASIPVGYETEAKIRASLGEPEYELRMPTWKLLDYSTEGVRFSLTPEGETHGVAYVPHGFPRVPEGERDLVDLTHLREGAQPKPDGAAALDGLKVGVAEVDVTPQGDDWLGHPYEVHDPLLARIAVFSDGGLTVALVGADLFGFGFYEGGIIRKAAEDLGVDHTIIGSSHNHAAGDTLGVYGHYPTEFVAYIQKQITDGIGSALESMQPVASFRTASRELPMDGARVMNLFRNARNPGVLDPTISILQAIGEDGEPITTIVNFACHVESLEKGPREISADFPGYMCEQMKRDGLGQPVFLNGAVGGMISGDNLGRTFESSEQMGLELAAIVNDMQSIAQPPAEFEFTAERRDVHIPLTNQNFIGRYEESPRGLYRGRMITDMTFVTLGEAQLITLPGEVLPEVSFEILEHMTGFPRVLIGLGNDQIGYFVPPYDFRNDYYEETVSPGPAAAVQVRDMAIRMLGGKR
jgi:hypothetical protein